MNKAGITQEEWSAWQGRFPSVCRVLHPSCRDSPERRMQSLKWIWASAVAYLLGVGTCQLQLCCAVWQQLWHSTLTPRCWGWFWGDSSSQLTEGFSCLCSQLNSAVLEPVCKKQGEPAASTQLQQLDCKVRGAWCQPVPGQHKQTPQPARGSRAACCDSVPDFCHSVWGWDCAGHASGFLQAFRSK